MKQRHLVDIGIGARDKGRGAAGAFWGEAVLFVEGAGGGVAGIDFEFDALEIARPGGGDGGGDQPRADALFAMRGDDPHAERADMAEHRAARVADIAPADDLAGAFGNQLHIGALDIAGDETCDARYRGGALGGDVDALQRDRIERGAEAGDIGEGDGADDDVGHGRVLGRTEGQSTGLADPGRGAHPLPEDACRGQA